MLESMVETLGISTDEIEAEEVEEVEAEEKQLEPAPQTQPHNEPPVDAGADI